MEPKAKETAVVVQNETGTSPAKLIELAISTNADIDKLSKLMDLQERWDAQQAKKAFLSAMSDFQSRCPDLKKTKKVGYASKSGGQVAYSYIPLGNIVSQIRGLLKECGLSFRWETKEAGELLTISCIISHLAGHSEVNSMSAQKDATGAKNEIQQRGSTMTYLQRYTLIGALGISSADEDIDGQQPKTEAAIEKNEVSLKLLQKYKGDLDGIKISDELKKEARSVITQSVKEGLSSQHSKELSDYVNKKYMELKKAEDQIKEQINKSK